MGYNPWRDASERHPDLYIATCRLAPCRGAWVPSERVVLIDELLDPVERDATLAHEVAHVDLEHRPTGNRWFDRRAEREADSLAAERLITVDELADTLAVFEVQPGRAAAELGVPLRMLRRRLEQLTDDEKDHIERRVAAKGEVA